MTGLRSGNDTRRAWSFWILCISWVYRKWCPQGKCFVCKKNVSRSWKRPSMKALSPHATIVLTAVLALRLLKAHFQAVWNDYKLTKVPIENIRRSDTILFSESQMPFCLWQLHLKMQRGSRRSWKGRCSLMWGQLRWSRISKWWMAKKWCCAPGSMS